MSVASTKSFVCQLDCFNNNGTFWFYEKNNYVIDVFRKETIKELQFISSHAENTIVNREKLKEISEQLVNKKSCFLIR